MFALSWVVWLCCNLAVCVHANTGTCCGGQQGSRTLNIYDFLTARWVTNLFISINTDLVCNILQRKICVWASQFWDLVSSFWADSAVYLSVFSVSWWFNSETFLFLFFFMLKCVTQCFAFLVSEMSIYFKLTGRKSASSLFTPVA